MNTRINAWDRMMGAATFAEAGEFETAEQIMARKNQQENLRTQTTLGLWDRVMAAITFAEAGEFETATQIMDRKSQRETLESRTSVQKQVDNRPRLQA